MTLELILIRSKVVTPLLKNSVHVVLMHLLLILLLHTLLFPLVLVLYELLTHAIIKLVGIIILIFHAFVSNISVLLLELSVALVELIHEGLKLVWVVGLLAEHHLLGHLGLLLVLLHHVHRYLRPIDVILATFSFVHDVFDHLDKVDSIGLLNHLKGVNQFLSGQFVFSSIFSAIVG